MPNVRTQMNSERFAALAAAYGGALRRWPLADREAAGIFARTEEGIAILQREGGLDAMLDDYVVPAATPVLNAGILRDAAVGLVQRRRVRLWWSGLGLAGLGLAGALAGTVAVTVMTPSATPEHYGFGANTTAFGDVASDNTLEEGL
jgi:hypothetical protein